MESLTHEIITTTYENLDDDLDKIPFNRQVGLVVLLNEIKYEFLLHIKPQYDDMICLGPSGLSDVDKIEEFKSRPMFTRHKWDFDKSILLYNDNTRYVWEGETGSGWGMGLPDDYFLENIKNMIIKITQHFNILPQNILFYGSSMGGFTSIQLATMIKGSFAIAENPQVDARMWINDYYLKYGMHSELYEKETLKQFEPFKYNVLHMIKKENYIPNLTIIHDINPIDIKNHLIPFIDELSKLPFKREDFHKIDIIIEPMAFHIPIPKDKLYEIIEVHDAISKHKFKFKIDYADLDNSIGLIKKLNLFDEKFYKESYPYIGQLDPLTHYLLTGWKEGKNPSREFDTEFYLEIYPDVEKLGVNPLAHYLTEGIVEDLATNESEYINIHHDDIKLIENSWLFDEKYYVKNCTDLENLTPAQHYFVKGWKEGKNPSKQFDNTFYLEKYSDVRNFGINPLFHYLRYGRDEDRFINKNEGVILQSFGKMLINFKKKFKN